MADYKRKGQRRGSDRGDSRGDSRGPKRFGGRDSGRRPPGYDRKESRGFDRRDSDRKEMTSVTCESCKKRCEVPFKPSGDKPVFCKECFMKKKDSESESSEEF